jgi:hypothetical protein
MLLFLYASFSILFIMKFYNSLDIFLYPVLKFIATLSSSVFPGLVLKSLFFHCLSYTLCPS